MRCARDKNDGGSIKVVQILDKAGNDTGWACKMVKSEKKRIFIERPLDKAL
jgi:hypothetical protein